MEERNVEAPFSDGALEAWVSIANRYDAGIGVTLQIGGLLVSGSTTSGGNFLRYVGESLSEAASKAGHKGESFKDVFGAVARDLYPLASDESDGSEEAKNTMRIAHIHLKDASLWSDCERSPIKVPYWRGRLDRVDAWFLGEMQWSGEDLMVE